MNEPREPQVNDNMSLEDLESARAYWIREMQRSFFPEAGTARRSLQVCEANLREIDRLVAKITVRKIKETKSTGGNLPFDIDNPLEFVKNENE